jgi:hypothetical protein
MMALSASWNKTATTPLAVTGEMTLAETKVAQSPRVYDALSLFIGLSLKLKTFFDCVTISVAK